MSGEPCSSHFARHRVSIRPALCTVLTCVNAAVVQVQLRSRAHTSTFSAAVYLLAIGVVLMPVRRSSRGYVRGGLDPGSHSESRGAFMASWLAGPAGKSTGPGRQLCRLL